MSIFLIVIGFLIRLVAIKQLGYKFSWRITIPPKLVTNGIYKYTRNPMYLGTLIFTAGLSLLLLGWQGMICMTYFSINFIVDRIDREEQILSNCFGEEYMKYMLKTKVLIPFIF